MTELGTNTLTEMEPWKPCRFDAEGSFEIPNLHDYFVYAAVFQLDQRIITLHTEYRDGIGEPGLVPTLIDLRFVGAVGHHFDDMVAPSILLHLEQVAVTQLIEQRSELFSSRRGYSWPIKFDDLADLSRKLDQLGVIGFNLLGTCGLDGFVLATAAEFRQRNRSAEFA